MGGQTEAVGFRRKTGPHPTPPTNHHRLVLCSCARHRLPQKKHKLAIPSTRPCSIQTCPCTYTYKGESNRRLSLNHETPLCSPHNGSAPLSVRVRPPRFGSAAGEHFYRRRRRFGRRLSGEVSAHSIGGSELAGPRIQGGSEISLIHSYLRVRNVALDMTQATSCDGSRRGAGPPPPSRARQFRSNPPCPPSSSTPFPTPLNPHPLSSHTPLTPDPLSSHPPTPHLPTPPHLPTAARRQFEQGFIRAQCTAQQGQPYTPLPTQPRPPLRPPASYPTSSTHLYPQLSTPHP